MSDKFSSKILNLTALPKELFYYFNKNDHIVFQYGKEELLINRMRTKSNVAEINGDLYYFGNTYGSVDPYKHIKNLNDLIKFIEYMSGLMDLIVSRTKGDVSYIDVSAILHDTKSAEKLLTVNDTVYPDYLVELPNKTLLEIEVSDDETLIRTTAPVEITKVNSFDLQKLFNAEFLNSLYIIKLAHGHQLDLSGIMNLVRQMDIRKMIEVITIFDDKKTLTIGLHIPEKLIEKVFAYKMKDRLAKVRVDDLSAMFIRDAI